LNGGVQNLFSRIAHRIDRATESEAGRRVRERSEAGDTAGLLALLDSDDYALKGRAASALGRDGDPAALDALAARLDSGEETDRLAGLHGLWRARDQRRIEPARAWLFDETQSSRLRHAAAAALGDDALVEIAADAATPPDTKLLVEGVLRASGWRP
jgi:HEAT repeat protein